MTALSRVLLTEMSRRRLFGILNIALGAFAVSVLPFLRDARAATGPDDSPDGIRPDATAQKYVCTNADCDPYVYDPAAGDADNINDPDHPIPPGTAFADLPHEWICPFCGSGKDWFRPLS